RDHPRRGLAEDPLRLPSRPSQLARPVRVRWLCLGALAAVAPVLAGCGGVGVSGASEATGNLLAVYSSLPLQGPDAAISAEIVDGERLALSQAGGQIGGLKVGYVSLDDAN